MSISQDNGINWKTPFLLHSDGIAAEHGFVSMFPLDENKVFATWLDGRNTKSETISSFKKAMTLRTAIFDAEGNLSGESELDDRTCNCCQTDAIMTKKGAVVIYRDRSADEIRDFSIVRFIDGKWTNPKKVFADNWLMSSCPVNGAAIATQGNTLSTLRYLFIQLFIITN